MPVVLSSGKPFKASASQAQVSAAVEAPQPKPKRRITCTRPKAPPFDLNTPAARLRNAHFQWYLGELGPSAFHARRRKGEIPPPDGHDPRPYWLTETVRDFLTKGGT